MSRRIYTEAFIIRRIATIDAIHERTQEVVPYPRCLDTHDPSPFHTPLSPRDREEVKAYLKWMRERAYVDGFWNGWTLREGCP